MVCWSVGLGTRNESHQMTGLPTAALLRFDQMLRKFARMAGAAPLWPRGGGDRVATEVPAVWRHDQQGGALG